MTSVRVFAFAVLCAGLSACSDQGAFEGTWTIEKVQSAPWMPDGTEPDAAISATYVGKTVAFEPTKIDGPELLACANPSYRYDEVPADGLFQGALGGPTGDSALAEGRAKGLGFAMPVRSLSTACEHDIPFHMRDATHAAFALDNMIFWMTKTP